MHITNIIAAAAAKRAAILPSDNSAPLLGLDAGGNGWRREYSLLIIAK